MASTDHIDLLRAMVNGDLDRHSELWTRLQESGALDGYGEVLAAAFYIAVRMQFPGRYCPEDVINLAAATRMRFDLEGKAVNPYWMELTIRSALGEHGRLDQVSGKAITRSHLMVCCHLAVEEKLGDRDAFMHEVQDLLDEWAA